MENLNSNESALKVLGAVLALIFFFAPVIVASAKQSSTLKLIALMLCLIGFIGTPLIITLIPIIGTALAPVFFGIVWIAAMICGAASFIANATERQAREAAFRLLHNDVTGLQVPDSVEKIQRKDVRF